MARINAKSSVQCEYCERSIPSGTEIEYETRKAWHVPCFDGSKAGKTAGSAALDALRGLGLEHEASLAAEAFHKASSVEQACLAADTALQPFAARASDPSVQAAREAVTALRNTLPPSLAKAARDRAEAQRMLGGYLNKPKES